MRGKLLEHGIPAAEVEAFMHPLARHGELVSVERIDPQGKKNAPIIIIESTGKPPKQFPDWE